jgi:hypothetical protein
LQHGHACAPQRQRQDAADVMVVLHQQDAARVLDNTEHGGSLRPRIGLRASRVAWFTGM